MFFMVCIEIPFTFTSKSSYVRVYCPRKTLIIYSSHGLYILAYYIGKNHLLKTDPFLQVQGARYQVLTHCFNINIWNHYFLMVCITRYYILILKYNCKQNRGNCTLLLPVIMPIPSSTLVFSFLVCKNSSICLTVVSQKILSPRVILSIEDYCCQGH